MIRAVDAERTHLYGAWPHEFGDGERCGFRGKFEGKREPGGYSRGFHKQPLDQRNAWFAGYDWGRVARDYYERGRR